MNALLPIAARLAATDMRAAARRAKRNTLLYALIALLAMTAYACGVTGMLVWVAGEWGPVAGALVPAAAFAALAFAVLATVSILNAADRRRARGFPAPTLLYASAALATLPLVSRPKLATGALVAGLAAFVATRAMRDDEGRADSQSQAHP